MEVTLGRTGIVTNKNAFGALPIQRVSTEYAGKLLRKAYDAGITYFDTARNYTDSEIKIGLALSDVRHNIYIASKTMAQTVDAFWKDLETTLTNLKTDYLDVYQFHNPPFCPKPGDGTGLYEAMEEARKQGKIRFISFTNHRPDVALEAAQSGLYDTLQFPFCYLSTQKDIDLVNLCKEKNIGFLSMKALSGGMLTNSAAAYAWQAQFDNALPLWGIQRESELDEFLSYMDNPPVMDDAMMAFIKKEREELMTDFCRGCGYCQATCPVGIEISNCARMSQFIRRSPSAQWLTPEYQEKMAKIEECLHCNMCISKCPYSLNTPALLEQNLEDYKNILAGKVKY